MDHIEQLKKLRNKTSQWLEKLEEKKRLKEFALEERKRKRKTEGRSASHGT